MEYANAAITIGGKIKRSEVEKRAHAIEADNAGTDWTDTLEAANEIEDCAKARRHLSLCSTDHPWGRFENVEAVCGELGLIYVAECEAGGEWHPMLQYHSPRHGRRHGTGMANHRNRPRSPVGCRGYPKTSRRRHSRG